MLGKRVPDGSNGKESGCNAGDPVSISGLGRCPGEVNGNPLQYSCLEKPHGQRSLVGYHRWGHKKSDMTEQLTRVLGMKCFHLLKVNYTTNYIKGDTDKPVQTIVSNQSMVCKEKMNISVRATPDQNGPPRKIVTMSISHLTTVGLPNILGTNKLPPTRKIQERSKGGRGLQSIGPINIPESLWLESILVE